MAPDSALMTCSTCRFVSTIRPDPSNVKVSQTVCRRYPPQVFPMDAGNGQVGFMAAFPAVGPSVSCGEWQAARPLAPRGANPAHSTSSGQAVPGLPPSPSEN